MSAKDAYDFDLDVLRKKEIELCVEIDRQSSVIDRLNEKLAPLEQQVQDQTDLLEKRKAEVQVRRKNLVVSFLNKSPIIIQYCTSI